METVKIDRHYVSRLGMDKIGNNVLFDSVLNIIGGKIIKRSEPSRRPNKETKPNRTT